MTSFVNGKLIRRRYSKFVLVMGVVFTALIIALFVAVSNHYNNNLKPVNSANDAVVVVAISPGSSIDDITKQLKSNNLIRADWAFKRYVVLHNYSNSLQAGTYKFTPSQDTQSIVADLVNGKVAVELFTIFPAQRLDQIRQSFINKGYTAKAVDDALKPSNYPKSTALRYLPKSATSLEGYLYPDSYQKTADTSVETIIKASLTEMAKIITPDVVAAIEKRGLTVHQAIIIASIVEQEIPASAKTDRQQAAQVFLKRLKIGMELGSDVTAFYGTAINNQPKSVTYDTPYNTRLHAGYPPGPIGNVTKDGLEAVAFPATTDYLYFVAGDDHITYFSKTLAEHLANVSKHCRILCN